MNFVLELFCGCFGGSAGFLEMGIPVIGIDIEHLPHHGPVPQGAHLVLQDVKTIHGSQFKDALFIWASPPCTEFSYMAMPWSRGKQIGKALRGKGDFPAEYTGSRTISELTALFDACFRIQREASEAAGRYIPMVVENVRGAQPWVGKAKASYGSFYLWGDIDTCGDKIIAGPRNEWLRMPRRGLKFNPDGTNHGTGSWFAIADSKNRGTQKVPGMNFRDHEKGLPGRSFQTAAVVATKNTGESWFNVAHNTESGIGRNPVHGAVKQHGSGPVWFDTGIAKLSSKSDSRKAASAQIAKIPLPLARFIARAFSLPSACP